MDVLMIKLYNYGKRVDEWGHKYQCREIRSDAMGDGEKVFNAGRSRVRGRGEGERSRSTRSPPPAAQHLPSTTRRVSEILMKEPPRNVPERFQLGMHTFRQPFERILVFLGKFEKKSEQIKSGCCGHGSGEVLLGFRGRGEFCSLCFMQCVCVRACVCVCVCVCVL